MDSRSQPAMIAELTFGGQKVRAALDRGVSLAIAVDFSARRPAPLRRGRPVSQAVRRRQFLRQRGHRRQRQLLDRSR